MNTFVQFLFLFIAALFGGTLNAVAGGGSFFTFPALVFSGVSPIIANATSTVALWPGSIASVMAYRRELTRVERRLLLLLIGSSLIGGLLGAMLLLRTSQSVFVRLVPYLLLMATVLFAVSPSIIRRLSRSRKQKEGSMPYTLPALVGVGLGQLLISIYGGYFGGGIGILMLATLAFMGMESIHIMNGVKTLLAACINGVAVITFLVAGVLVWPQALVMIVGALIGGYGGAAVARKVEQKWIRFVVILVGSALTVYFFVRSL